MNTTTNSNASQPDTRLRWYTAAQLDTAGKVTPIGHMADPRLEGAAACARACGARYDVHGWTVVVAEYLEAELVRVYTADGHPFTAEQLARAGIRLGR